MILVGWMMSKSVRLMLSVRLNAKELALVCNKGVASGVMSDAAWQPAMHNAIKR